MYIPVRTLLCLWLILCYSNLQAGIVIDSIVVTPVDCQNNGSITVFATDTGQSILYSITSGPVIKPAQVNNNLTALPAGTYTVKLTDANNNSDTTTVIVTGSYTQPVLHPRLIYPSCRNSSNFLLLGNIDSTTGSPPYTWQLVNPSPVTTTPQITDTFHISAAGTYAIQCTDNCGNIQTTFFSFNDTLRSNIYKLPYTDNLTPIWSGCNSIREGMGMGVTGDSSLVFPVSITVSNTHGNTNTFTQTQPLYDTLLSSNNELFYYQNGTLAIAASLPNTNWNDSIYITIYDGCGDSLTSAAVTQPKAIFNQGWGPAETDSCQVTLYQTYFEYFMYRPNTWQIIDSASNTVIASGTDTTANDYAVYNLTGMDSIAPGGTLKVIVADACGDTIIQNFEPPPPPLINPASYVTITPFSCLDSTATAIVYYTGFGLIQDLEILSGPAQAQSTKSGYSYSFNYIYPQSFTYTNGYNFVLSGLAPGIYTYKLRDGCGDTLLGQFNILPDSISSLNNSFAYIKGCVDENSLVLNAQCALPSSFQPYYAFYYVNALNNQQPLYSSPPAGIDFTDTVLNIASGTYVLSTAYDSTNFWPGAQCNYIHDTVIVPPYVTPVLTALVVESCGGSEYILALPDSSTGIAPFTYSVISGPQMYPVQADNKFRISQLGTYTLRITDACENSSVRDISVDSLPGGVYFKYSSMDSCFHANAHGHIYYNNSIWSDTLSNMLGCDSLILVDSIFILGTNDTIPLFPSATDTFCNGKTGFITAASTYFSYLWNNGNTEDVETVSAAGTYSLTVTDNLGCTISDTVLVAFTDSAYIVNEWVPEIEVCNAEPVAVNVQLNTADAYYSWNVIDAYEYSLNRTISDSGLYIFTVSNQCGSSQYNLEATLKDCYADFYVPNAFSPNGDGINDVFAVYFSHPIANFNISVFNRWGDKMFESNNENIGWNGQYKGVTQPEAVYVYQLDFTLITGQDIHSKGSVTLLR